MRFASALATGQAVEAASRALLSSTTPRTSGSAPVSVPAIEQVTRLLADQLLSQMSGERPTLALMLFSPHFGAAAPALVAGVQAALGPGVLLGCSGESIIGRDQEIEHEPAIAVLTAALPGVKVTPFALAPSEWSDTLGDPDTFQQAVGASQDTKLFIVLGDGFSTPTDEILDAFNRDYPGIPLVGGMASASNRPGGNVLVCHERITHEGIVGVALAGDFEVDVIVSQGCRPIGETYTVTAARGNIILSLDGVPPLTRLHALIPTLPDEDRALLRHGLFVGRAISPDHEALGRGDFLIRGVMGGDRETGALAIGDYIHEGEVVQFHLRDATTAAEDPEMMLMPQTLFDPPLGALLFSCNGRGTRLYPHPNGDITIIQNTLGDIDIAGFFCAGELGPIGGQNFLHGHTASLALFRPAAD